MVDNRNDSLSPLVRRSKGLLAAVAAVALAGLAGCLGTDSGTGPVATINDGPYSGKINSAVLFNGTGTDADEDIAKYQWDFDGDGTYDWESATSGLTEHTYATAGTYTAKFLVIDEKDNTDWQEVTVTVGAGEVPVADAGGPYRTVPGVPVYFIGSGSDADGSVATYEWDLDGDGAYELSNTTAEMVSTTYSAAGDVTASLRVTDDDGNTGIGTVSVDVMTPYDVSASAYTGTLTGHAGGLYVGTSPEGPYLVVSGGFDATVKVQDLSGSVRFTANATGVVYDVTVSPDGKYLVAGVGKEVSPGVIDGYVEVWTMSDGAKVHTIQGHAGAVRGVAVDPFNRYIVSGSVDNLVKVWNLSDGSAVNTLAGHTSQVNSVAISPDGEYIVSGSRDNTVKVWGLGDGSLVHTFTGHTDQVLSVAVSPDGVSAASGSEDMTLQLWNLADGSGVRTMSGHTNGIRSIVFSPDGKHVVSGSYDKTVKIWSTSSGAALLTHTGHTDFVWSVAVSSNGEYLVSAGRDETIRVHQSTVQAALARLAHFGW